MPENCHGDCGEGCICGGQALGVNLRRSDHFLSLHADETRVSIGRNVLSTGFIMGIDLRKKILKLTHER